MPVDRTILGLPLYGMTWPVIGPGVGQPSTGRGDTWVPRWNLETFADPSFEPTLDPIESVEFYAIPIPGAAVPSGLGAGGSGVGGIRWGRHRLARWVGHLDPEPGWNAVYYDSPRSLTPKLLLADERGLAGAGFWAIGYERGVPGYRELISTFRAGDLRAP